MREILILIACFKVIQPDGEHQPEDINDLFPIIDNTNSSDLSYNVNMTFDIGKIDVKKLMEKIGSFNASVEDKPLNDTRRQILLYRTWSSWWFQKASDHIARQKTTDLMLQMIYMAKHIIKDLEVNPAFIRKDNKYKIDFLNRKMLNIFEKVQAIYPIMLKNIYSWHTVERHIYLHTKSVKLHTDFLYLWWVLIKVDGKLREKNNDPPKLPKNNTRPSHPGPNHPRP